MKQRHQEREPFRMKDGTVLTDEVIEQLSREAEAGYDLTKAEWVPVGRQSPEGAISGEGAAPRVSFRASRTVYEAARARAAREGRTVSALAREAMERYVQGDPS